jgi:hypothetical protein
MVRAACPANCQTILTSMLPDSRQARVAEQETRLVIQQAANDIDEIKCSWLPNFANARSSRLNLLAGNQLIQLLRSWLSPTDPSTNHNIARKSQHNGTATWLFQGQIIIKWKSTGSLLWIHGKRVFLLLFRQATSDCLRLSSQRALGKASSGSFFLAYFRSELILL